MYSTLQRLERDGLVDAEDETQGPQQRYRITDAGRDDLDAWLRTPPDTTNPPRDELVMKVLVSLRIPGVDTADLVQGYRRHVIESMQQYTRLKEHAGEADVGLLLVADAELFRLEAVVRWLDTADARIRRLPARWRPRTRSVERPPGDAWGHGDDHRARAARRVEVLRRGRVARARVA